MGKFQISLAAARVNAGLTQEEAAKALKVGKQTIVSWEKGNSEPKMSQSRQLSELYKIPLDYIFLPTKSNLFRTPSNSIVTSSLRRVPPSALNSSIAHFTPCFPFS